MEKDVLYLYIYIALWAIASIFFFKKKKFFGAGNLILATYLIYAVLAYFLYMSPAKDVDCSDFELFPFLYLFAMVLISLLPVLRYDERNIIIPPDLRIINYLLIFYLIISAITLPLLLGNFAEKMFFILNSDTGGDELYYMSQISKTTTGRGFLFTIIYLVFNVFSDIVVFFFFYSMTLPKTSKLLLLGLFIAIFLTGIKSLIKLLLLSNTLKYAICNLDVFPFIFGVLFPVVFT